MAKKSLDELNTILKSKNSNLTLSIINNEYYLYCENCKSFYSINHLNRVTNFVNSNAPRCTICEKGSRIPLTKEIYQIKLDYLNKDRYIIIDEKFPEKLTSKTPVDVLCTHCNEEITVTLDRLVAGNNCRSCANIANGKRKALSKDEFIEKLNKVSNGEIQLVGEFINTHTETEFKCSSGHIWTALPRHIIYDRNGCSVCNDIKRESQGEKRIRKYLENNNIKFKQFCKDFTDCVYIKQLEMDFYLEEYNLVIEFDGYLHTRNDFDNEEQSKQIKRDKFKDKYCQENGIKMLRISYIAEDNIENILDNEFRK